MKKFFISLLFLSIISTYAQSGSKPMNQINLVSKLKIDSTFNNIIYANENIIAWRKDKIRCIDLANNIIWENQLIDSLLSNVLYVDDKIIYIDSNNELTTISIVNGKIIQSIGLDILSKAKIFSFNYKGNHDSLLADVIDNHYALLFIFDNGTILCLDLETFQEYWRKTYDDFFNSNPIFLNNKFLITSQSGYINYFDLNNGLLLWRWKENENFQVNKNCVMSDEKYVYFINNDNFLFSLNLLLGKLNWKIDKIKFSTLLFTSNDKKYLYTQNEKNKILQIKLSDGTIINEIQSNLINVPINFVFQYNGINFFVINNMILSFHKNKFTTVYEGEFCFKNIVSTNNDKIILIDVNNNILIFN